MTTIQAIQIGLGLSLSLWFVFSAIDWLPAIRDKFEIRRIRKEKAAAKKDSEGWVMVEE